MKSSRPPLSFYRELGNMPRKSIVWVLQESKKAVSVLNGKIGARCSRISTQLGVLFESDETSPSSTCPARRATMRKEGGGRRGSTTTLLLKVSKECDLVIRSTVGFAHYPPLSFPICSLSRSEPRDLDPKGADTGRSSCFAFAAHNQDVASNGADAGHSSC